MAEIEAPEIEVEADDPNFRRVLAIVVVLITLFAACLAYLHEQNGNLEDRAARDAQLASIRGFGQQVAASTESQFDYKIFVQQQLLQRRQLVAASRERTTDSQFASVYQADAQRYTDLNNTIASDAPVKTNDDYNAKDASLNVSPDESRLTQQVLSNRANDFGNKSDAYVAILTVLAVGLFLIGLSLTVSGRGRYMLAVPGIGIAIVCLAWSAIVTLGSVTDIPQKAVELTAQGQQKQAAGDLQGAIDSYHQAIQLSSSFGPAYARLSDAEFENGVSNTTGNQFESISKPDNLKRAIEAGDKALSLGESKPAFVSSLGFFHFAAGDFSQAESLSAQALQGNGEFPPFIFNLGVAQAAQNEKSAALATYKKGIDILKKETDSGLRQQIVSAALTDLEIADASTSKAKDLIQQIKGELVDVEFATNTDASDTTIDGLTVRDDRYRLLAEYDTSADDTTVLTNVWYFRPIDAGGKGPFVQAFTLDTTSTPSNGHVSTTPRENGPCLPGGDYRVEIYAGSKLVGSNDDSPFHLPDSGLGPLTSEGGDSVGITMCRPENWDPPPNQENGSLSFANRDDPNESIVSFSFPIGTTTLATSDLQTIAVDSVVQSDALTGVSAPQNGFEFLGRTVNGTDVELPTTTVTGQLPSGVLERITTSVGDDGIVRTVVIRAGNSDRLNVIRAELINSLRFLDVPEPNP